MDRLSPPSLTGCFAAIIATALLAGPVWAAPDQQGDGPQQSATPPPLSEALERLNAEQKRHYEAMKAVMPYYDEEGTPLAYDKDKNWSQPRTKAIRESMPKLDTALRECLWAAFSELRTVEAVRRALRDSVTFQEVPVGLFDTSDLVRKPLPGHHVYSTKPALTERERLPAVFYWRVKARCGAVVYVLKDSLIRPSGGWGRCSTAPYTVIVAAQGAHLAAIPMNRHDPYETNCDCIHELRYFVDAIDTGAPYPSLVTVSYGGGQALDLRFYRADCDPKTHTWKIADTVCPGPESSLLSHEMRYDPATKELRYRWHDERFGEGHHGTLNLENWVHGKPQRSNADGSASATSPGERPVDLAAEIADYLSGKSDWCAQLARVFSNYRHGLQAEGMDFEEEHQALLAPLYGLSEQAHGLIERTYLATGDWDATQRMLAGVFEFRILPGGVVNTAELRRTTYAVEDNGLGVASYGGKRTVMVVQNLVSDSGAESHVVSDTFRYGRSLTALRTSVAASAEGKPVFHRLPGRKRQPCFVTDMHLEPTTVVAVMTSRSSLPAVVTMTGPGGRACNWTIDSCWYEDAEKTWRCRGRGAQHIQAGSLEIDQDTCTLAYDDKKTSLLWLVEPW